MRLYDISYSSNSEMYIQNRPVENENLRVNIQGTRYNGVLHFKTDIIDIRCSV